MAHPHHENNDSYHLHHPKSASVVSVFNQDGFLMAEYSLTTGAVAWHRVAPSTKREAVERRLTEQFPVIVQKRAPAKSPRTRRTVVAASRKSD